MAEYKEIRQEHLYVKVPGTETLRKTAAARLRYLLSTGWRETDRRHFASHLVVQLERSGHAPLMTRLPKPPPPQPRLPRQGFGARGGPGGPRGSGPGGPRGSGPGGPRGSAQGGPRGSTPGGAGARPGA